MKLSVERLESRRLLAVAVPATAVPPLNPADVLVGTLDIDVSAPGPEVVVADGVPAGIPIDAFGTLTTHDDAVRDGVVRYEDALIDFAAFNVQYVNPYSGQLVDAQGATVVSTGGPPIIGAQLIEFPVLPILTLELYITADVDGDGAIDVIVGDDVPAGTVFIDVAGDVQTTTHWDTANGIEGFVSHFAYHPESNRFVNVLAYDPDGPGGTDPIEWANNVDGAHGSAYGLF